MKMQKGSPQKRVISTAIVLVVLTLSVYVLCVSAEDRDNDAIRIYAALTSIDAATTEYVHMPCSGESMYPKIVDGDNVKVEFCRNGSSIHAGDIIVYNAWMVGVTTKGMWIGHRVTEKHKEGDTWYFRTKGDNCPEADGWKVPESTVLGKVVSVEHAERSYIPTKTTSDSKRAT